MAVNDVYEVDMVGALLGQRVINVFHTKEIIASTAPIPARSVGAAWKVEIWPTLRPAISIDYILECIYVRRIFPTFGIPYLTVVNPAEGGSINVDAIPGNASAVITFYTELASKSGRGRKYICGIPESKQGCGLLTPDEVALLETFAEEFALTDMPAALPDTGRWRGVVWSDLLQEANEILEVSVHTSIGTMRSRRQPQGLDG